MILAFDAGAFQQGIAGGILSVAVNFLNSATAADPSLGVIFVADPLFGEVRPEAMAKLTFQPPVVYESVLKPAIKQTKLLTLEPAIQIVVDGSLAPYSIGDDDVTYRGPSPRRSFELLSRSARPCETFEKSTDGRTLGISFSRIDVESDGRVKTFWADDPRFDSGNNGSEGISRWMTGHFSLPPDMLPSTAECVIRIERSHRMIYRISGGRYDGAIQRIEQGTVLLSWQNGLAELAARLKLMGANAYMANHFLPVRLPGLKLFAWAYDIIPVVHPEFFDKDAIDNFNNVVDVFKSADALFCISEFTRSSIKDHLQIDAGRLHTSWIGASPAIRRRDRSEVDALKSRLAIIRPYILCVGTIEPRKNHVALVHAYAELLRRDANAPDLVVAGMRGWGYGAFFDAIAEHEVSNRVRHFEHLTDNEVAALYSGSELVVYPSLFEGFGLPVLEAMRCGVPVVTSRGTSMEDIARDCSILIDPKNVGSIATGMEHVLRDPGLQARLVAAANRKLPQFEWDAIARTVLNQMRLILQ